MSLITRIKDVIDSIKEWKINKRTSRASDLDSSTTYDILLLQKRGFLRARATGQSITNIYAEVENLINKTIKVSIAPGIYFIAKGNYQNMVTREKYIFTLNAGSNRSISINATCINAGRPIPGEKDRFYGVRRVPDALQRFLEASQDSNEMTIQAGVWAITDNYSKYQVQTTLVSRDRFGNKTQAVSDSNIAEAKRILDKLGVKNRL